MPGAADPGGARPPLRPARSPGHRAGGLSPHARQRAGWSPLAPSPGSAALRYRLRVRVAIRPVPAAIPVAYRRAGDRAPSRDSASFIRSRTDQRTPGLFADAVAALAGGTPRTGDPQASGCTAVTLELQTAFLAGLGEGYGYLGVQRRSASRAGSDHAITAADSRRAGGASLPCLRGASGVLPGCFRGQARGAAVATHHACRPRWRSGRPCQRRSCSGPRRHSVGGADRHQAQRSASDQTVSGADRASPSRAPKFGIGVSRDSRLTNQRVERLP